MHEGLLILALCTDHVHTIITSEEVKISGQFNFKAGIINAEFKVHITDV